MEEKTVKKTRITKKKAEDKAVDAVETSAAVDAKPVRKRAAKSTAAEKAAPKRTIKLVKKDSGAVIAIDPFEQTVGASENVLELPEQEKPVKKRIAAKAKTAKSATTRKVRAAKKAENESPALETAEIPAKKKSAVKRTAEAKRPDLDVTAEIAATEPKVELSPAFKALADVQLPELKRENRARLLMQSPTRAYFYWSVRENPWQQLKSVFGDGLGSYTLVIKFVDLSNGSEQLLAAEAEGNYWFDVEPDKQYRAEIGFYAPNRPYFRVIYSNTIETPRCSPSTHPASDARWTLSATKFAEVLDVSGFSRDAFDVAMAGDDVLASSDATSLAFSKFVGGGDFSRFSAEDIRYAMLSIAGGVTLEELRSRISASLFAALQSSKENISATSSRAALKQYFDIDDEEWTEEEFGSAVYGASLVHFPKTLKSRKPSAVYSPRYNPVSSWSLG